MDGEVLMTSHWKMKIAYLLILCVCSEGIFHIKIKSLVQIHDSIF